MTTFFQRLSTLACAGVAFFLSSGLTYDKDWYKGVKKSLLTPPDWVFPVVWTILYLMIAVAGIQLHRAPNSPARKLAVNLYNIQLLSNGLWSYLFFRKHLVFYALIDVAVMVFTTAGCMWMAPNVRFWLLPYLLWISFASYLNFSVYLLNAQFH